MKLRRRRSGDLDPVAGAKAVKRELVTTGNARKAIAVGKILVPVLAPFAIRAAALARAGRRRAGPDLAGAVGAARGALGQRLRPAGLMRPLLIGLLAALAVLLGAGTAFAHTALTSSDPADGATLPAGPARVTLTFDEPLQAPLSAATLVGPDGGQYQDGAARVTGPTVELAVRPLGPAGKYTVGYRVVSADGHPVSGSISFTVSQPGPGRPATVAAGPPGDDSGAMPVWPWILGAGVLIGGGAVLALRSRQE